MKWNVSEKVLDISIALTSEIRDTRCEGLLPEWLEFSSGSGAIRRLQLPAVFERTFDGNST